MTGGRAILGVSWTSIFVGTVVVSLRLYSKASRKALSRDDYMIGVALVRRVQHLTPKCQTTPIIPLLFKGRCLSYNLPGLLHLRICRQHHTSSERRWQARRRGSSSPALQLDEMDPRRDLSNHHRHHLGQNLHLSIPAADPGAHTQTLTAPGPFRAELSHRHKLGISHFGVTRMQTAQSGL